MTLSISVICPAWQASDTLAETLASVHAQTLPPSEILVVDDGSTDKTSDVGRSAGARVIRQDNRGAAAALNRGVVESRGDLLAFIDADDLWPAHKLAVQTALLSADPAVHAVLGRHSRFLAGEIDGVGQVVLPDDVAPAWLSGALLVRRAVFNRVGMFDESLPAGHAIDWFDRARRAGIVFSVPDEIVLLRRVRPDSLSRRSDLRDRGYVRMARKAIQRRRTGGAGE